MKTITHNEFSVVELTHIEWYCILYTEKAIRMEFVEYKNAMAENIKEKKKQNWEAIKVAP